MRAITAQEQTYFRTRTQKSRLRIYVRKPTTIYTAQVNGAPTTTDVISEINFDNGSGVLGDVKVEMTMYVGSTAGAYDLGLVRIRKAPIAGTFYIGEMSDVDWPNAEDAYLTVVDDPFGAWARHLTISGTTPYMDVDVAYSDQLTDYDPFVIMGTDRVVLLESATVDVEFDASDSWAFDDTIASYSWSAPGASATSGTATATPTITYNAQGQYRVYCTVTTTGGKSFTGARTVYVDAGTMGIACTVKNIRGSVDDGGWTFSVEMIEDAAIEDLLPNTQILLVAEDWYGDTKTNIGPIAGSENILCIGWIVKETLKVNVEQSRAEFKVAGLQYLLRNIPGFVIGIENNDSASDAWTNAKDLTVPKGLFFALHWRATVTHIVDVFLENITWETIEVVAPEGNLFSQLQAIAEAQILGQVLCNRYSQLFIERDPQIVPEADRTWDTVRTIAAQDHTGEIEIEVTHLTPVSRMYVDGVHVSGRKSFGPLFSLAPGHTFKRYGRIAAITNLLLNTQSESNELAGLLLAWRNNKYPSVDIPLTENDRMEDIAPQQYVAGSFTDAVRNVTVSGNFIPREVEFHWSEEDGILTTELLTEAETTADISINGDIPEVGDISTISTPTFNLPTLKLPEIPITVPLQETGPDGPKSVLLATNNFGVIYSTTFNEYDNNDVKWNFMNAGLDAETNIQNYLARVVKTPSGALFALFRRPSDTFGIGAGYLYWAPGLGVPWQLLMSYTDLTGTTPRLIAVGVNPNVSEEIAVATGRSNTGASIGEIFTGDRTGLSAITSALKTAHRIGDISYGNGKWYLTHAESNIFDDEAFSRVTAGGTIEKNAINYALGQNYAASFQFHKRAGIYVYQWNYGGDYLRKIEDNDGDASNTTQPNLGGLGSELACMLAVDPTGQYLMGGYASVIGKRSSDYGVTWGNVDASLSIGYTVWENCNTPSRFITATNQSVKYTNDFGDTWYNRTGNLATLAPLCVSKHLLYISD